MPLVFTLDPNIAALSRAGLGHHFGYPTFCVPRRLPLRIQNVVNLVQKLFLFLNQ